MPAERMCSQCGAPLPENAPGGRCPKCLVQLALDESRGGQGDAQAEAAHEPGDDLSTLPESDMVLERTGMVIGRYKLLQQIGEGGFGIVFMAEQTEPVQRKVALKVIKAGMDTREIIARFEAERQALALMDHPNIARIFDAGVTEAPLRSAGFQPAVSPTSSRQAEPQDQNAGHAEAPQAGSPAIQQTGSLRYDVSAGRPYFVMELV